MRASSLFYYLSKAHALVNGNKRVAVTSLMVFMGKNKKWINIPKEKLIDLSIMFANTKIEEKNIQIEAVAMFIKKYTEQWARENRGENRGQRPN